MIVSASTRKPQNVRKCATPGTDHFSSLRCPKTSPTSARSRAGTWSSPARRRLRRSGSTGSATRPADPPPRTPAPSAAAPRPAEQPRALLRTTGALTLPAGTGLPADPAGSFPRPPTGATQSRPWSASPATWIAGRRRSAVAGAGSVALSGGPSRAPCRPPATRSEIRAPTIRWAPPAPTSSGSGPPRRSRVRVGPAGGVDLAHLLQPRVADLLARRRRPVHALGEAVGLARSGRPRRCRDRCATDRATRASVARNQTSCRFLARPGRAENVRGPRRRDGRPGPGPGRPGPGRGR